MSEKSNQQSINDSNKTKTTHKATPKPKLEMEQQPVLSPNETQIPGLLHRSAMDLNRVRPNDISHLQRTLGNQGIQRLANNQQAAGRHVHGKPDSSASLQRLLSNRGLTVQPKLTVGAVNDPYEREADQVANQVVQMSSPTMASDTDESAGKNASDFYQEFANEQEAEGGKIQPKLTIQRTSDDMSESFDVPRDFETRLSTTHGGGSPLSTAMRTYMEPRMGSDFSKVRLHTNDTAVQLSREIGAKAFTHGTDIYFNENAYAPGSEDGRRLLAHELTHVVQQGGAGELQRSYADMTSSPETIQRYRSEINNFARRYPKNTIISRQQQLLGKVGKDNTNTLRRKGSGSGSQSLSKSTLKGPTAKKHGEYHWLIQWKLSEASKAGGWIVQKVNFTGNIEDDKGKKLKTGWEKHSPYWEAWKVNKNQKVTEYAENGDPDDDTYANPGYGANTKGTTTIKGDAKFYEGLTLPSSFKVIPGHPAGILLTTKSDPNLSGGTPTLDHDLTATWDSTKGKSGKTTLATT